MNPDGSVSIELLTAMANAFDVKPPDPSGGEYPQVRWYLETLTTTGTSHAWT
jgi:hypothetical protein|tara:strand:- start:3941 stop:4096 length:156 start_codon:yes stop_codon:yes gene_type:complete